MKATCLSIWRGGARVSSERWPRGRCPRSAFGWLQLTKPPPGVVGAEHRFAKRRLEHLSTWKPTQDELSKLRGLVNHKAGREIM